MPTSTMRFTVNANIEQCLINNLTRIKAEVSVESQDLKLSGTCLHFTYVLKQQLNKTKMNRWSWINCQEAELQFAYKDG